MPTIRITSAAGGWSIDLWVAACHGTAANVARQLKERGCTGQILPKGIVLVDADKSKISP